MGIAVSYTTIPHDYLTSIQIIDQSALTASLNKFPRSS